MIGIVSASGIPVFSISRFDGVYLDVIAHVENWKQKMKKLFQILLCVSLCVSAFCQQENEPMAEKVELLARYDVEAIYEGVLRISVRSPLSRFSRFPKQVRMILTFFPLGTKFRPCMFMTAECPDRCGHAGYFASFRVTKVLSFESHSKWIDGPDDGLGVRVYPTEEEAKKEYPTTHTALPFYHSSCFLTKRASKKKKS